MEQAKQGSNVKVHYTGKLEDNTVFDSSENREPIEFKVGEGKIIPGFEGAVEGMSPGESKTEKIPSDQAYGPYREEMVMQVDRQQIPSDIDLQVGQQLQIRQEGKDPMPVIVTDVADQTVTLDANHPLAGQDLFFDIQLLEVTE
ncbi:MAG: peptidylprolyl isomerase [Cyanobacteria bacterium QH_8_48_120]|jgi:peptidylprolyl isomerase|nr:MAG: peptidylprolyl isomerase [Cyanobacteria bacterium QH_1_48_107]PSO60013.1 MAG: peptidylprolyl isomerase [Cyanobacteria bacterium QH_10_48_56]PSO62040.1 MAG: peptidylprolyl isomerase [Cyanobacteria bacterium QH_7_48_89]PSO63072.1 MAG: peptidylprolyl isomerase [Cyanobacteria bacterium QH_2_48_84]PSO64659.1 MAG: peptidylprolyl isomerase [Cyanobacteria bacterium QH_6_48_35]PSO68435.1 MAG: peptidylprolyl isomerase [Cyanobacteria bacterium QS_1_48_34]PSO73552.1 MAG: peptidylprolyl isomerase 